MDRFDKFTDRARKVLTLAQEEAQRFNHNYIGTEHLLLGLVREGEGVAASVLENLGVELNKVRSAVEFIIGRGDRAGRRRDRADAAREEGHRAGRRRGAPARPQLHRHRAPAPRPRPRGRGHRRRRAREPGRQPRQGPPPGHPRPQPVEQHDADRRRRSARRRRPPLDQLGINLTEAARAGNLDPVIGREKEIERVIQILSRRTKNNPALIGEPGVGKTAIAEGLAHRIVSGDVPGDAASTSACSRSTSARSSRARSTAASSRSASRRSSRSCAPATTASCSSTSCTRSSAPARPRARSTPPTS